MDSARGFVLPRRFTLAQGELLSLAPVTLQPPIKVPVHVLDEHGNPYEGVFVDSTTGGLTHAPVRTDAKGVAVIPLAPDSNGIMSIAEDSLSGSGPAVVACHFLLHGDIPEKSPYVLVLPRQDAPRVFGDASKTDSGKSPPTLVSPNHDPSRVFGDTPNTDSFPLPKLRLRRPY
jgi:hypothetical protein